MSMKTEQKRDLATLVAVYIYLGEHECVPSMVAEGVLTQEQGEGWTMARDAIQDFAEEQTGAVAFAREYRQQQG